MIFVWSARNIQHVGAHEVAPAEAEEVVTAALLPFPEPVGGGKHLVWGRTRNGRYLQVVFVYVAVEDVEPDEYERLEWYERVALEEREEAVRVIHARDLTETEKARLRRRQRGKR